MAKPKFDETLQIANYIAEQIWREQSLTSNRMTWNLTFQGFMMAAFALVATSNNSAPARAILETVIALAGSLIAFFTLQSVKASERQRDRLKVAWRSNFAPDTHPPIKAEPPKTIPTPEAVIDSFALPAPFSEQPVSALGRGAPRWLCFVIMSMWCALLGLLAASLSPQFSLIAPEKPTEIRIIERVQMPSSARPTPQPSTSATGV